MAFGLLLSYLCSFTFLDLAHFVGHQHEGSHCSEEIESDLCHQSIYHLGESACEHSNHYSSTEDECSLCEALLNRPSQFTAMDDVLQIERSLEKQDFNSSPHLYSRPYEGSRNRGPPIA